jgi:hypothetical protein
VARRGASAAPAAMDGGRGRDARGGRCAVPGRAGRAQRSHLRRCRRSPRRSPASPRPRAR